MDSDFEVDAWGLRRAAATVEEVGARVTGAAGSVPAAAPAPRWATSSAAELAADATERLLRQLGAEVSGAAGHVEAAATAYEDADHRAADRFRRSR
ncbi:hypothetical protein [Actinoplanes flavus]|uniref:Excreted virulence factor EspC, type VII ESX diderm n=1 Tax=Actinoplanes flavus TaxID=2820290 RepID=A0ABS3UMB9_9ACTN|nr:hypothetical protein [Actinoplanes flavus]MBO3739917.1 hypothetical protein [Actinoplanes flavus]